MTFCSAIKAQEKGGKRGWKFMVHGICLLKQPLCVLGPCFPQSDLTSACQWKAVNYFLFFLFLHAQLLFSLLNCCYLDPQIFLPSFYFLSILWERGVSLGLGRCLAAVWGQPTTEMVSVTRENN